MVPWHRFQVQETPTSNQLTARLKLILKYTEINRQIVIFPKDSSRNGPWRSYKPCSIGDIGNDIQPSLVYVFGAIIIAQRCVDVWVTLDISSKHINRSDKPLRVLIDQGIWTHEQRSSNRWTLRRKSIRVVPTCKMRPATVVLSHGPS